MVRDDDAPNAAPGASEHPSTDLLTRLSRGDPAAISTLYRAHADVVARVATRLGAGGVEDVEDIVQTTFLEAMRGTARFAGESNVRSWLIGIAVNLTRAHRRSAGRARKRVALFAALPPESPPLADKVLADEADRIRLRAAFAKLPDLQREALVLCELEGLPAREVSAMLGAPPATIWRRVHDAKVSLRRLMAEAP